MTIIQPVHQTNFSEGLYNAWKHYLKRSLQAQLIFVYDILMACYNIELKTVRITILGTRSAFLIFRENPDVGLHTCTTMEFQNINFTLL
jgi:hypothetical protein